MRKALSERRYAICDIPVYSVDTLEDYCRQNKIDIGVLTVPKEAAKAVAETMARGGVRGIWNFANMELEIDDKSVIVQDIHLGDSLMTLCYDVKEKAAKEGSNE